MADFKEKNILKDNSLMFAACKNGDVVAVIDYLEAGGTSLACSENNPNLASIALQFGQMGVVRAMLERDLDVNEFINRFRETPLVQAVRYKHVDLVGFLLNEGADVNLPDEYGCSPFVKACGGSTLEIVKMLLDAGGDLADRRFGGVTPFRQAAKSGRISIMEYLIDNGASIEEKDSCLVTSLIGAAKSGKKEVVEWLLAHGADIQARDEEGKCALDWAEANGHADVVRLLK